uniref:Reverse transcriptase domain-containing protein n=1 Tax=Lactuca sativa TaxID=4236 RepID=A0A9R1XTJ2_LACSA|nr:hypothetical protein LSAT_V11C100029210 [Lactuca sativa]
MKFLYIRKIINAEEYEVQHSQKNIRRGVYQGDQLSPVPFVISIEDIIVSMLETFYEHIFRGVLLPMNGPCLTYLHKSKFLAKLSSWKMKNISFDGRDMLVNSMLAWESSHLLLCSL